jgi:hypothetical protein
VAAATGATHLAAATGRVSEEAARALHGLGESALIDMGDFAGATLKLIRRKPVARLTIAGGFGNGRSGPRRAPAHPFFQVVDLGSFEPAPQGHLQPLMADSLDQQTLLRLFGDQGGTSFSTTQQRFSRVDPQHVGLLFRPVAAVTVHSEHRTNTSLEKCIIHRSALWRSLRDSLHRQQAKGAHQNSKKLHHETA